MIQVSEANEKLFEYLQPAPQGEFLKDKSKVGIQQEDADDEMRDRNIALLRTAENYYSSLYNFRKRRQRAVNFYRGDQWNDTVTIHRNGRTEKISEYDYLTMQGRAPLKQNMIRPALKSLLGSYRSNPVKPLVFARNRDDQQASEMMSVALDATLFMNESKDRDARALEEFLISGGCVYRTSFSYDDERRRAIPKFQQVNINRFFYNTDTEDVMGKDVDFVGALNDMSIDDLISTYAKTRSEEKRLREIYSSVSEKRVREALSRTSLTNTAEENIKNIDFYLDAHDDKKCRVIEIWRKESEWRLFIHDYLDGSLVVRKANKETIEEINKENEKREELSKKMKRKNKNAITYPPITFKKKFVQFWKCYHLSPTGDTIFESETPYEHGSHPFVFTFYPLVDGRAWGMVEDLIDQQKMINRNMILFDFINGASAKGVLLVPEESIPDDCTIEDFADEWTKFNGVIKIRTKAGAQMPHQVITSSVHPGLNEMIQMQLKFMEDIGGVHDAAYGRNIGSSAPSSLYAQQVQQSGMNNLDYIATFNNFIQRRDLRLIQLIQQYFTDRQYIQPSGNNYTEQAKHYDPDKIRDIDFDNSIGQSNDTPAFRALADNTLTQLLQMQAIDAETYLENCSLPYADNILKSIRSKQLMAQQQ